MIQFDVKTWRCTTCGLDARDRDPFDEANLKAYMPEYPNLKPGECVNCETITHAPVIDVGQKTKITIIDSQADIDAKRTELEAEPIRRVKMGVEIREETPQEKSERINREITLHGSLKAAEKAALRQSLESIPALKRELPVYRDELPHEKTRRINHELSQLRVATPAEIQQLRDQFEDK